MTDPTDRPSGGPDTHLEDGGDIRDLVTSSVSAQPWATLGAALVLGFLLGRMLR